MKYKILLLILIVLAGCQGIDEVQEIEEVEAEEEQELIEEIFTSEKNKVTRTTASEQEKDVLIKEYRTIIRVEDKEQDLFTNEQGNKYSWESSNYIITLETNEDLYKTEKYELVESGLYTLNNNEVLVKQVNEEILVTDIEGEEYIIEKGTVANVKDMNILYEQMKTEELKKFKEATLTIEYDELADNIKDTKTVDGIKDGDIVKLGDQEVLIVRIGSNSVRIELENEEKTVNIGSSVLLGDNVEVSLDDVDGIAEDCEIDNSDISAQLYVEILGEERTIFVSNEQPYNEEVSIEIIEVLDDDSAVISVDGESKTITKYQEYEFSNGDVIVELGNMFFQEICEHDYTAELTFEYEYEREGYFEEKEITLTEGEVFTIRDTTITLVRASESGALFIQVDNERKTITPSNPMETFVFEGKTVFLELQDVKTEKSDEVKNKAIISLKTLDEESEAYALLIEKLKEYPVG